MDTLKIFDDRFDLIEMRAARNMMEADHYWKHRLHSDAVRMDILDGFLPRMKRVWRAITFREGLR